MSRACIHKLHTQFYNHDSYLRAYSRGTKEAIKRVMQRKMSKSVTATSHRRESCFAYIAGCDAADGRLPDHRLQYHRALIASEIKQPFYISVRNDVRSSDVYVSIRISCGGNGSDSCKSQYHRRGKKQDCKEGILPNAH